MSEQKSKRNEQTENHAPVSNLVDRRAGQDNFSNWLNYKRKMNDDAKLPISDKSWMTKIEH